MSPDLLGVILTSIVMQQLSPLTSFYQQKVRIVVTELVLFPKELKSDIGTIIFSQRFLPGDVLYTPDCAGMLTYDGREHCVLNMNKFPFTYEVLRGFMFHFLLGWYIK